MNLCRSFVGCFAAVEVGALVSCLLLSLTDNGVFAVLEGVAIWVTGQFLILPIALFSMLFGALIRMILGFLLEQPKPVALTTGTLLGSIGAAGLATSNTSLDVNVIVLFAAIGALAGLCGGWAWWRVEKPYLERLVA